MPWIGDSDGSQLVRGIEGIDKLQKVKVKNMSTPDVNDLTSFPAFQAHERSNPRGMRAIESNKLNGDKKVIREADDAVIGGVEHTSSQPPSPPATRPNTPRLSIMPSPARLTAFTPPFNYGCVQRHMIYRSGFPQDQNIEFLQSLRFGTILTLVETAAPRAYKQWVDEFGISHHHVDIAANKDGQVKTTLDSLCEAVLLAMNPANHPIYIHCNQGRHRTGCVIACLRKAQKWPLQEILQEYHTYADPKARPGDIDAIKSFDPDYLLTYAEQGGRATSGFSILERARVDSKLDIYAIAEECIPAHDLSSISPSTNSSTVSRSGLEIQRSGSVHTGLAQMMDAAILTDGDGDRHDYTDTGVTITELTDEEDDGDSISISTAAEAVDVFLSG